MSRETEPESGLRSINQGVFMQFPEEASLFSIFLWEITSTLKEISRVILIGAVLISFVSVAILGYNPFIDGNEAIPPKWYLQLDGIWYEQIDDERLELDVGNIEFRTGDQVSFEHTGQLFPYDYTRSYCGTDYQGEYECETHYLTAYGFSSTSFLFISHDLSLMYVCQNAECRIDGVIKGHEFDALWLEIQVVEVEEGGE